MLLALLLALQTPARPAPTPPRPPAPVYFTTPPPLGEMREKQAVIETSAGTIVLQLLPDAAPNHVGLFMKLAREGAYAGTLFHRVIRYGIIQGGDPLTRDATKAAQWGQGGLNQLRFEANQEKATAGAVAAVLQPSSKDSGGAQFFICVTDQPALDGNYTIFARVVDGLEIVQQISAAPADANGRPAQPVEIRSVTIRETPVEPFVNETPAQLASHQVRLETSFGAIDLQMLPDKAPETVRAFLRMANAKVYDGTAVHRVAPNFVMQTGALAYRDVPLTPSQQKLVHNLPPEFTDTPNLPGVVSMARGEDPASASTSFFICIGDCRSLDGKYTVFARVSGGMTTVNTIAAVPVDGETPRVKIVLKAVVVR